MTNFEKIKNMNIDEMSDFLVFFDLEDDVCSFYKKQKGFDCRYYDCSECTKKYLLRGDNDNES